MKQNEISQAEDTMKSSVEEALLFKVNIVRFFQFFVLAGLIITTYSYRPIHFRSDMINQRLQLLFFCLLPVVLLVKSHFTRKIFFNLIKKEKTNDIFVLIQVVYFIIYVFVMLMAFWIYVQFLR
jgi:hypothetical protein